MDSLETNSELNQLGIYHPLLTNRFKVRISKVEDSELLTSQVTKYKIKRNIIEKSSYTTEILTKLYITHEVDIGQKVIDQFMKIRHNEYVPMGVEIFSLDGAEGIIAVTHLSVLLLDFSIKQNYGISDITKVKSTWKIINSTVHYPDKGYKI